MLRSHLTTTLRRLRRDAGYAAINLTGLAVGLAACLLIGLYVRHELSFDTFHPAHERTYRVTPYEVMPHRATWRGVSSGLLAPRLRDGRPDVEQATRLDPRSAPYAVAHGGQTVPDVSSFAAEPQFFDVFGFALRAGTPDGLARPFTLVLTESLADRLFPDTAAVGQRVTAEVYGEERALEVVGVMADPPSNTHLGDFDALLSFASLATAQPRMLPSDSYITYARLRAGADPDDLVAFLRQEVPAVQPQNIEDVRLDPVASIHFADVYAPRLSNPQYVALFGAIAGVVLLIACVNYMNLATARTTRRGRETGVRKVLGARRHEVVLQFLSEAVVLSLLALPCALALAALLLPPFNALTGVEVAFAWTTNGGLLLALVVATLVVGLLAGSYPALALSCYRPLQVLRGQLETGARGRRVRQVLVVTQFALTAALLFATGMVMRQLEYIQTRDLGFATERVVAFDLAGDASRAAALRAALGQHPEVQHVAFATGVPGTRLGFFGTSYDNFERDGERIRLGNAYVDTAFAETVGLTRVAGRFVRAGDEPADPEASQPSEAVVLNETAAERLGWVPAAEAVGETFSYYEGDMRIVGVVEDFHFRSLHHRIEPLMLHYRPAARHGMAVVRLRADVPLGDALDRLEAAWGRVMPHLPFEPRFADDAIEAQYRAEERAATLVAAFAVVAVVLACLGLVGLATYAAARRTKEISVRKVLGASATQIVVLLGRQFAALVAVALVVGAPVALYGVTRWLEGFAYRAPLSPLTFAGAAGLVLAIALLSVGVQTLRAARTDPAEALRAE